VLALLVLALVTLAPPASAGDFPVRQCQSSNFDGFFGEYWTMTPTDRVDVVRGCNPGGLSKIGVYQDRSGDTVPFGAGGQFIWAPGTGIQIVGSTLSAKLRDANGIDASVFGSTLVTGQIDLYDGEPHDGQLRTTRWIRSGPFADQVVARLSCRRSAGCPNEPDGPKAFFEIFDLEMMVRDYIAPSLEISGPLEDLLDSDRWIRGSRTFSLTASDWGSGIERAWLEVNGLDVRLPISPCAGDRGAYAVSFSPCLRALSHEGTVDTSALPFREGENTVRVCVADYALSQTEANRTCTPSGTLLVDNQAPAPPVELTVGGGSAWRAVNGFEFSWRLPEGQRSPVSSAEYRVFAADGGPELARGEVAGSPPVSAGPVLAPAIGAYRVEFRLVDSAGNVGAPAPVLIRFDDSPPGNVQPEPAPGWVSADEFPLEQTVEAATAGGPSGIAGYAISVSGAGPVRPCAAAICEPGELKLSGGADDRVAYINNLQEGSHWISTLAASGAWVSSRSTGTTVVRVDRTDPESSISGVPAGWVDRPVTVTVSASDDLSGMEPRAGDHGRPQTVIAPEGQSPYEVPGAEASFTVAAEGVTRVRFWAEDLAGNANDGLTGPNGDRHAQPGSAVVRIDTVSPTVAFFAPDPDDPELVTASVHDSSSGVDRGLIAIRPLGTSAFEYLPTMLEAGRLSARVPSDDLRPGTYELRAEIVDRAGNEGASVTKQDGSAMVMTMPVKSPVEVTLGRDRAGGTPVSLVGSIRGASGAAMSAAPLTVEQRFAAGSHRRSASAVITSDGAGRFRVTLKPGPTRSVRVLYAGTRLKSRAASGWVRVAFTDRTSFRVRPSTVRNGGRVIMTGRVRGPGAIYPAGGKLVAIQFFDPSRSKWRPVEVLRAGPGGRFRFSYRFRTITSAQRIEFRAVSLPEAGWPYRPSTSAPGSVIVYPAG
jgi:hypothetical protein